MPPRRDVRRIIDVLQQPRTGDGEIIAGFRDRQGTHHTTGENPLRYFDTQDGRYLLSYSQSPGTDRYVNLVAGRSDTMLAKIKELLVAAEQR